MPTERLQTFAMRTLIDRYSRTLQPFVTICSLTILLLVGCATYPLDMTKEQWEALPPAQQAEARTKQAEIDAQKRAERLARLEEERRLREQQQREAEERLRAIYENPRYGDIIIVQIEGGEIGMGENRYPYQPVRFELARGETKFIDFVRQDRPTAFRELAMGLEQDASIFYFGRGSRYTIRIPNDGWQTGRTFHPPEVSDTQYGSGARNIRIYIRFKDVPSR